MTTAANTIAQIVFSTDLSSPGRPSFFEILILSRKLLIVTLRDEQIIPSWSYGY